jgi:hypothetical protein
MLRKIRFLGERVDTGAARDGDVHLHRTDHPAPLLTLADPVSLGKDLRFILGTSGHRDFRSSPLEGHPPVIEVHCGHLSCS